MIQKHDHRHQLIIISDCIVQQSNLYRFYTFFATEHFFAVNPDSLLLYNLMIFGGFDESRHIDFDKLQHCNTQHITRHIVYP